jgi:chromosome condensin MukBEF MukE localization factor
MAAAAAAVPPPAPAAGAPATVRRRGAVELGMLVTGKLRIERLAFRFPTSVGAGTGAAGASRNLHRSMGAVSRCHTARHAARDPGDRLAVLP